MSIKDLDVSDLSKLSQHELQYAFQRGMISDYEGYLAAREVFEDDMGYDDMTPEQLRALVRERGIDTTNVKGKKAVIKLLDEWDEAHKPETTAPNEE